MVALTLANVRLLLRRLHFPESKGRKNYAVPEDNGAERGAAHRRDHRNPDAATSPPESLNDAVLKLRKANGRIKCQC